MFTNFEIMPVQTKSKIYFFYPAPVNLRKRTVLKEFIESIFKAEGKTLRSLNYVFCTDEALLGINRQYLGHDYYTDVITFELSEKGAPVEGEVYISIDRVRDNASAQGVAFITELHRVIFHGALHLCGYKDKSPKEIKSMREAEERCLAKYARLKA